MKRGILHIISSRMEEHPRNQRSLSLNKKIAVGKLRTGAHGTKLLEREREQEPSSRKAQEEAPFSSLKWDGKYRVFE